MNRDVILRYYVALIKLKAKPFPSYYAIWDRYTQSSSAYADSPTRIQSINLPYQPHPAD